MTDFKTQAQHEIKRQQESYDRVMRQIRTYTSEHEAHPRYSDHVAHNLASRTQELATIAGKIEVCRQILLTLEAEEGR